RLFAVGAPVAAARTGVLRHPRRFDGPMRPLDPGLAGPSRSLIARARAPDFARLRLAARRPTPVGLLAQRTPRPGWVCGITRTSRSCRSSRAWHSRSYG